MKARCVIRNITGFGQSARARMGIARALKGLANYCGEDEAPSSEIRSQPLSEGTP